MPNDNKHDYEQKIKYIDNALAHEKLEDKERSDLNKIKDAILTNSTTLEIEDPISPYVRLISNLEVLNVQGNVGQELDVSYWPYLKELYVDMYDLSDLKGIETLKQLTTLQVTSCKNWSTIKELSSLTCLILPNSYEHKYLLKFLSLTHEITNWAQVRDFYNVVKQCNNFDSIIFEYPTKILKEQLINIAQSNLKEINFKNPIGAISTSLQDIKNLAAENNKGSYLLSVIGQFKGSGFYEQEHEDDLYIKKSFFSSWPNYNEDEQDLLGIS